LLQHVIFHRFVTGESNAGNGRTFFYLNQKGITITKDANILKVAGSKQSANPSAPYTVALLNSSDAMSNFFIAIVIMRSS